jgi:hypothetical protein
MIIDNESCSQKIINNLQTNNIDYIDRIQILYKNNKNNKNNKNFITKTLEILINRKIEEYEFLDLIHKIKDIGIRSHNFNNRIQFINTSITPMHILYDYKFITEEAMVMNFKCRIECNSIDQLNFNGMIIDKKSCRQIINNLQAKNIHYIDRFQILSKKNKKIITKTLEFFINRQIDEDEFLDLIHKMKDIGISSNDFDNRIQFINTAIAPINILYDYNFISEKTHTKTRNNYIYYTNVLYKKT